MDFVQDRVYHAVPRGAEVGDAGQSWSAVPLPVSHGSGRSWHQSSEDPPSSAYQSALEPLESPKTSNGIGPL